MHDFGDTGFFTAFVDDGQIGVQPLGQMTGADDTSDIRRYHHQIFTSEFLLNIGHKHRRDIQIIDGDIEEALNLARVQFHRQHPVGPSPGDQVGHQLCRNRCAPTRLAVLPRVAVIRNDRRDASC